MPFASIHFIFIFLPVTLLFFYLVPNRVWKNIVLSVASLVFFGWVDPTHIPLLLIVIFSNYFLARLISHFIEKERYQFARTVMWIAVLADLLLLIFYKYLGFLGNLFIGISKTQLNIPELIMPLGISYFTFSALSYIFDVYNRVDKAEKNIIFFTNYMIMFPKLVQGPITRYGQVKNELDSPKFNSLEIMQGIRRFIMGLAKKMLFANTLGLAADNVFNTDPARIGAGLAWYGLIAYTLQIYFDFAGYSDMAVGLGKIFGFKLPENFNFPYISRSITEFWRRWHMSLTAWFRTYIFIPLEFNRRKQHFLRQQINILIVFALTGLWHGASWHFLIWGIYFGLILAIESSGWGKKLKNFPVIFQYVYSSVLIMFGWVLFRIPEIKNWGPYFKSLLGFNGWRGLLNIRSLGVLSFFPVIVLAIVFSTPLLKKIEGSIITKYAWTRMIIDIVYLIGFVLGIFFILANGFSPFLYSNF